MATYTGDDNANDFDGISNQENNAAMKGGNDYAYGGDLNDTLDGGTGDDHLIGGSGEDYLTVTNNIAGFETYLDGGAGDDTIQGGASNDEMHGDGGADYLDGGSGFDTLDGGAGDDDLVLHQGGIAEGGSGDDIIYNFGGAGSGAAELSGGTGDDTFTARFMASGRYEGGAGEDMIDYTYQSTATGVEVDLLSGRGGEAAAGDTYYSIEDVSGTPLADILIGNGSVNSLYGGDGDDTVAGGGAGDYLDGGMGTNTLDYHTSPEAVQVNLAKGTAYGGDAQEDQFLNFANILGSAHNDTLTGDDAANLLNGKGGNDTLSGGKGDDTLDGGSGNDHLDGGSGHDQASYADAGKAVTVSLAITKAQDTHGAGTDLLKNIEGLLGSSHADTLTGSKSGDQLDGGAGDDRLDGGAGSDTLTGGSGTDSFIFDTALGSKNIDHIIDFDAMDDQIVLNRSIFSAFTKDGVLASGAFHAGTLAHDQSDRIIYDPDTGNLYYDHDGKGGGAEVQFAVLAPHLDLKASDFIITG